MKCKIIQPRYINATKEKKITIQPVKQQILIVIIAMAFCYFFPKQGFAQRKLITSSLNSAALRGQVKEKNAVVDYMQKKSKTGTVDIFQFNAAVLRDSIFFLDVFAGNSLRVVKDETDKRGEGDFSLYMHIQGSDSKKEGSLVLVYLNGEVSGNINYKSKNYAVHPFGKGRFALYEIDFKKFPEEDAPAKSTHDNITHDNINNKSEYSALPENPKETSVSEIVPICRIRIIVAFTPNAENQIKTSLGYSTMIQFINQAIAETNQAYLNSNVNFRVELSTAVRVAYTESGDYDTDLSRFKNTGEGYMDEIHNYRNLYSADLCVLIFNNDAYCGLADGIGSTAASAFCVVHYSCALGYYSFAHEMGHLYGCRHNPETDNHTTPYAYGHGYVYQPGGWRTIMAYSLNGETRLQYFSNPTINYNGHAMGTSNVSYNAKVLNETAGAVRAFRGTSSALSLNSSASLINDEIGDATSTSYIDLLPGFQVSQNSYFNAHIKNCSDLADQPPSQDNYVINEAIEKDVAGLSNFSLNIYPNPTNGMVKINGSNADLENARITVNDQFGREVYKVNNKSGNSIKLNLGHLVSGIYYININTLHRNISRKLIILK